MGPVIVKKKKRNCRQHSANQQESYEDWISKYWTQQGSKSRPSGLWCHVVVGYTNVCIQSQH